MARNVLLLSATIRPMAGLPVFARSDPAVRLLDYCRALDFYDALDCFDAIVFAENSGYDLSELKRQHPRIEFLSFDGLNFPAAYGRGYGEFLLVDYATAHAQALKAMPDDIVWKCTGRYKLRNIAQLVADRPDCDLYCHMRNHPYRLCELFSLSWNLRAYEIALRGVCKELRNDLVPGIHTIEETLFRKVIDRCATSIRIVPRFKHVPIIEGIRAWNNSQYTDQNWAPKIVSRRIANTFMPRLWI